MNSKHFIFEKKLGAGGFGTAYLVRARSNNTRYVIKYQFNTPSAIVRNEVKALKMMRHQNIVSYYNFWREGERNFILMEYATHGTLKDLLDRRSSPLREEDAMHLFSQIVLGVRHIHKRLVLHRDLKPGNIMLTGQHGDVVKIGDFGVSKDVRLELGITVAGTKLYMAPEIFEGRAYDYKCDIWSIGIILYEMVTKKFPFNTKNHFDMMMQIDRGIIRPVPRGFLSASCVQLYCVLLKRNPTERPSAESLLLWPFLARHVARVYQYQNIQATAGR